MSGISSFGPERAVCHQRDKGPGQGKRVIGRHAAHSATQDRLHRKSILGAVTPTAIKRKFS